METLQKLTLVDGMEQWTLFPEGSPANPTAKQENDLAKRMNATCGPKCLEQFARFPRVGLWAKTFAGLLIGTTDWYSTKCRLTWKLKGTKSNRIYFQLAVSTLRTEETASGLLPTVKTFDATKQRDLDENGQNVSRTTGQKYGVHLTQMAVSGLLPTPSASDHPGKNTGRRNQDSIPKRIREAGGQTSQLNPRFVAEMMGFPPNWTELPFQSGETKV